MKFIFKRGFLSCENLKAGEDGLEFAVCRGETPADRREPTPRPRVFHGEYRQSNQKKKNSGEYRQKQPYHTQNEQDPAGRDKCHTFHHSLVGCRRT
jgi:hypothetical protein